MRVLPTIWVHIWSVSHVFSHSTNGRSGQLFEFKFQLPGVTNPILDWPEEAHRLFPRFTLSEGAWFLQDRSRSVALVSERKRGATFLQNFWILIRRSRAS